MACRRRQLQPRARDARHVGGIKYQRPYSRRQKYDKIAGAREDHEDGSSVDSGEESSTTCAGCGCIKAESCYGDQISLD